MVELITLRPSYLHNAISYRLNQGAECIYKFYTEKEESNGRLFLYVWVSL